jgi:hypothetical protein
MLACTQSACGQSNIPNSEIKQQPDVSKSAKIEESKEYPSLRKQAQEFCDAIVNNDHEKAFDLTHRSISAAYVAKYGSREKAIEFVRKDTEKYEADGFKITKISISEIGKVEKIDGEFYSIITIIVENNSPSGKTISEMPLFSNSNLGGESWTFIDGLTQEKFKRFFPKASEKIQIPNPKRIG